MGHRCRENKKLRYLKLSELGILLTNVMRAAEHPDIGFEHADFLLDQFLKAIDKIVKVKEDHLQACLWSANLLNEKGKWWHPTGKDFSFFVNDLLANDDFDYEYNLIIHKDTPT